MKPARKIRPIAVDDRDGEIRRMRLENRHLLRVLKGLTTTFNGYRDPVTGEVPKALIAAQDLEELLWEAGR